MGFQNERGGNLPPIIAFKLIGRARCSSAAADGIFVFFNGKVAARIVEPTLFP